MRDRLENIPDRMATVLAAELDPAIVHRLLLDEIRQVLNELSTDARGEAARGAAERMAA